MVDLGGMGVLGTCLLLSVHFLSCSCSFLQIFDQIIVWNTHSGKYWIRPCRLILLSSESQQQRHVTNVTILLTLTILTRIRRRNPQTDQRFHADNRVFANETKLTVLYNIHTKGFQKMSMKK